MFVKPMKCLLGYDKNFSLSPEIKKLLRPLQFNEELGIDHNWGNWFSHENHTLIRVYGFGGIPNILPMTIPDQLAYLEIVRHMNGLAQVHLRASRK